MRDNYSNKRRKCKITFSFVKTHTEYSIENILLYFFICEYSLICQKPRERVVTDLTHKTWDLGSMLAEPSYAVERILQTKPNQLVILTPQELEQYIFDELFQRTKNNQ